MKDRPKFLVSCYCLFFSILLFSCTGQPAQETKSAQPPIGGGCDGCELMYIGMPKQLNAVDTSAGWNSKGQALLVTGTVYEKDGTTPAPNVIIYYWHTNDSGYYASRPGLDPRVVHHGYIRGWVRTDSAGRYSIYTVRPGPYPGEQMPAHIHLSIKEPALPNEYYVDDLHFDDDPLLIPALKAHPQQNRGGSGILRVLVQDGLQIAEHDIILGLNIPHYPTRHNKTALPGSGLKVGEDQPSFTPYHAYGPDKGSTACPVCKYGRHYGILYFAGKLTTAQSMEQWLLFLDSLALQWQGKLKVYLIAATGNAQSKQDHISTMQEMGQRLGLRSVALTVVPSFDDLDSEVYLNRISPEAENTFVVFRNRRIIQTWANLKPGEEAFTAIGQLLQQRAGNFFGLPGLPHDE